MRTFDKFSVFESEQMDKVKEIGDMYGNSPELKKACKDAYDLYRSGKISANCYGRIYSDAFDNYLQFGDWR
jgi:hypothetical protein